MLEPESQAKIDVANRLAELEANLAYVVEDFTRLKTFLNKGCILLREETPVGVHWSSASRSGKSFNPWAVQQAAMEGLLRLHAKQPRSEGCTHYAKDRLALAAWKKHVRKWEKANDQQA